MISCIPFQTLDIFSTDFVVQYVSDLVCGNLFTSGTFVNTVERKLVGICLLKTGETHPTMVTPIGQGALPMDKRRYESLAFEYCRFCMWCTISATRASMSGGRFLRKEKLSSKSAGIYDTEHTRERISLNKGLRYSADCLCVAAASFPCVVRLIVSVMTI